MIYFEEVKQAHDTPSALRILKGECHWCRQVKCEFGFCIRHHANHFYIYDPMDWGMHITVSQEQFDAMRRGG